jgi:hypothetical protein
MADEPDLTPAPANIDTGKPSEGAPPEPVQTDIAVHQDEEGRIHADFGDVIDQLAAGKVEGRTAPSKEPKKDGEDDGKQTEEGGKGVEPAEDNGKKADETPAADKGAPAKPADGAKPDKPAAGAKRDDDLDQIEARLDPHTSPRAKEHFKALKQEAIEARNAAEKAAQDLAKINAELAERKKAPLPKETEQLVKDLTEQIREIDITRDPAFRAKYDTRIQSNNTTITNALIENGLDQKVAERLQAQGYSLGALKTMIDQIESGKDAEGNQWDANPDLADQLRTTLRENAKLSRDRETEFTQLKATYDQRMKEAQANEQKQLNEANERMHREFKSHVDRFPFLQDPPKPLDTDTAAVRKEKEAKITEFNGWVNNLSEAVKRETSDPLSSTITARVGILYRDHVVPRLQSENKDLKAQLEAANTQLAKLKKAGSLTPSVQGSGARQAKSEPVAGEEFGDALDHMARTAGVLK